MVSSTKTQAQAPARSRDQRMEALERANDIRVRRAKLKKDLKDGRVKIETILNAPPEYVSTAKVFDILMAVPKFGRVKAARFLNQCRISQSKTVGGLSERQRAELVGLFARISPAPVFVVTGPSGAGKGTLIALLLPRFPVLRPRSRRRRAPQRAGERDGVEYWFLSDEEFARRVDDGRLPRVGLVRRQPLRDALLRDRPDPRARAGRRCSSWRPRAR